MLLGVIADDFTGASDIANTLARGGMATTQLFGIPKRPVVCEAGVVALKTRSIPASEAVAQSMAALRWLQTQGCKQYVFKYCSTFDSTPEGNIGPVGEALAEALNVWGVVACPAFPTAQRTIFQGHLFVGDRLLSESPLRHHPLNPMTDSDLRRWLRQQTRNPVGLITHPTVVRGPSAIASALKESAARRERLVIVDAVGDTDLLAIGAACKDAPLVTGGSGIALGLAANLGKKKHSASRNGVAGPAAILAGSCSARTLEQIEKHLASNPGMAIEPDAVMESRVTPKQVLAFVHKHANGAPLVYSSAAPDKVSAAQKKHGRDAVAHAMENFFADCARQLVDSGTKRLVIAGGETSGAVVSALGLEALEIGPEIDPGVPALFGEQLGLALKSGNFGDTGFFARALRVLQQPNG